MTRLTEADVRRIIREEIAAAFDARQDTLRSVRADIARVTQAAANKLSQIAPVINIHNPVAVDPQAAKYGHGWR